MELAEGQHDVIDFRQLRALGYGRRAVQRRVANGRLHPMFIGVYAVGTRNVTRKGRWMAAVLACGQGAALSHRSAISLHGLRPGPGPASPEVSAARSVHGQPGLQVHRPRVLLPDEVVLVDHIPVTTLARTTIDFAATATAYELKRALNQMDRSGELDLVAIQTMIAGTPHRRGGPKLRALLAAHIEPPMTRSELEDRFFDALSAAGLPLPSVNVIVEGELVDFYWPRHGLIAELDGFDTHKTRAAFEADRARDRLLNRRGRRILRFTYWDVDRRLDEVLRDVAEMIAHAAAA